MKKKEKTVCQIIRFRGKIEAFFVSIDEFATSSEYPILWTYYPCIEYPCTPYIVSGMDCVSATNNSEQ